MKFTNDQIKKAKTARTSDELIEMAKAENIEITKEESQKFLDLLNKQGELSDEELIAIVGGSKGNLVYGKYPPCDWCWSPCENFEPMFENYENHCRDCKYWIDVTALKDQFGGINGACTYEYLKNNG